MKNIHIKALSIALLVIAVNVNSQEVQNLKMSNSIDKVQALKDTITEMMKRTDNALFINHCKSFIKVIDAQTKLTHYDSTLLIATYDTFCNATSINNCRKYSSYLERKCPLIIAWQSPTDGVVSVATVTLPKDWDPEKTYPVYVHLHGLSSNYALPVDILTRFYLKGASTTYAYEDGYWLAPWGRGNLWYQGISETDVRESKAELERLVNIDLNRQYITGHSMGGFGSWYIASRSAGEWAALGVEAGALNEVIVNEDIVLQLKDVPTYFVCGTKDGLINIDTKAYNLLKAAGNTNTKFVTFVGAHEHLYSNDEEMYLWMKEFVNEDYYVGLAESTTQKTNGIICHPNPFSNSTTITFNVEKISFVRLSVYSSDGKYIKTLVDKLFYQGTHEIKYSSIDLLPGLYYCTLEIEGKQIQHKILVKSN